MDKHNNDQNKVNTKPFPKQTESKKDLVIKDLTDKLTILEQKYSRALADYHNLEKRIQKEKEEWINFANVDLLTKLLDIIDNLDRASIFITDPGLKMIKDNFDKLLQEFSVEEIQAMGAKFDHLSMECVESANPDANIVTAVIRKGYKLHKNILRPAQVAVGHKLKVKN